MSIQVIDPGFYFYTKRFIVGTGQEKYKLYLKFNKDFIFTTYITFHIFIYNVVSL